MAFPWAVASVLMSAYGAYTQYQAGKKAAEQQAHLARLKAKQAEAATLSSAREAVRRSRSEIARAQNAAVAAGIAGSSSAAGAISGAQSRLTSALSGADEAVATARVEGQIGVNLAKIGGYASTGQAIGTLGGTIFGNSNPYETIFGGNKAAGNLSKGTA